MTKSRIRIGVRDNRLGRILGAQVAELLAPHVGASTPVVVPVADNEKGRGPSVRWPGLSLEHALAEGEIDVAVQNMKDLPPDSSSGIVLAAVTERFTPFDVLIARDGTIVD